MNLPFAKASRPIVSCCAARSDQARHQSSHFATDAVTSSKSVSATPFATKRGPQWAIADLTMSSIKYPSDVVVCRAAGWRKQPMRALRNRRLACRHKRRIAFVVHAVELRRRPVDLQMKYVRPIVVAGEIVAQLHLHADLEIAVRVENAFFGAHRSRDDTVVRRNDHTAAA